MKIVVIERGLPGSGKSTKAFNRAYNDATTKNIRTCTVSADNYFMQNGRYIFNSSKLQQAHEDCFSKFLKALLEGCELVIVDNTNTQVWEFEKYMQVAILAGYTIEIDEIIPIDDEQVQLWCQRCTHGVPLDAMRKMFKRWETFNIDAWLHANTTKTQNCNTNCDCDCK